MIINEKQYRLTLVIEYELTVYYTLYLYLSIYERRLIY